MSGIKYYTLRTGEEPPMEFVAIRHVDGENEFIASYVNSSYLSYENGVLLKMHERNDALRAENAKLREQMERLVTLLRVDCDIDASWDGLRRFWSIGLTEDGCLMRDRACKAEADNAKLRELVDGLTWCCEHYRCSQECQLYDVSEPDHCREVSIKRELGMEIDE